VSLFAEWVDKAEADYQSAVALHRRRKAPLPDIVCYHCQQCVEKYLKAYLIAQGSTPPSRLDQGLAAVLADIVAPRLARCAGLVVTGGETARHLLARAGLAGIRIAGEVEVGVPWGWGLGLAPGAIGLTEGAGNSGGRGLAIVTKAGAFGDARTLVRCRRALRATGT